MAFFSGCDTLFSSSGEWLKRSERLSKERLQYLVKELAKELEQGEILLQSLPIGIILLNKDFHLQLANRAARRSPLFFSAFPQHGPLAQKPIWQGLSNEELAHWLESELQTNGVSQPREFHYFDERNELHVIRIEISSQVRSGFIEGWIILISDISELRQQERKVQQLDILASLATVTAGVAHEIKNPLTAMSLHVQLMERLLHKLGAAGPMAEVPACSKSRHSSQADWPLDPECLPQEQLLEYCGIIREEIERLNTFVSDFLMTVRPLELELLSQDIHQVIWACLELLQPELENKGIALELALAEELPKVALDTGMFKRLLLNLLQNAIQSIEEKKEREEQQQSDAVCIPGVPVAPQHYGGRLFLKSYLQDDKVYLEIADNGCGMSEEVKKKILEPFFTTRAKGSGLGMTMVLRILQTHNGDLQIQTEEGRGSVLRISLPVFHREQKLLVNQVLL